MLGVGGNGDGWEGREGKGGEGPESPEFFVHLCLYTTVKRNCSDIFGQNSEQKVRKFGIFCLDNYLDKFYGFPDQFFKNILPPRPQLPLPDPPPSNPPTPVFVLVRVLYRAGRVEGRDGKN